MNFFQKSLVKFVNIFYPYKIFGLENTLDKGAVVCSNHFSMLDLTFIAEIFDKNTFYLAKKELFKNKLIASILKSYGGISIDRENVEVRTLMKIIKLLKDGNKVVVFPEGTRNKTNSTDFLPFKGGSMVFAVKSKKPIIPIVISHKARLFKKTYIQIGESFELSDFYDKKITNEEVVSMENIVLNKMKIVQQQLYSNISRLKSKGKKKSDNL